jgi:protein-L-isoaspartate(D-aspartate) O-methyltransferase
MISHQKERIRNVMKNATWDEMIEFQLEARDINDRRVLKAMCEIDRALFVPGRLIKEAYEDRPLPIGYDQTISQPYVVAFMAQSMDLKPDDIVLEIGTGCGYNAAVLSKLVRHVYSIEIIAGLAETAIENLKIAGVTNVEVCHGDGYAGWPDKAPFDAVMLTASPSSVPAPLKAQLKTGGKLLAPVGDNLQYLTLLHKLDEDKFHQKRLLPVNFVPMTGAAAKAFF